MFTGYEPSSFIVGFLFLPISDQLIILIIPSSLVQTDLPVRERIFLLLDATQTALGGASGKFPQYYAAYYDLVVGTIRLHKLECNCFCHIFSQQFLFYFSRQS